jgi:glycosyltransferase involved in cell wall biosynthesis
MKTHTSPGKEDLFTTPKIAIILPAYNEEITIEATVRAFQAALPEADIWIINNRSSDATESIARATLSSLGCSGGVLNESRKGKGNAVRRAFLEVDADIYVLADADLTYPAERVRDLLAPIISGHADMVVGDRHSAGHYAAENKRALHGAGNRLVRSLVNGLFSADLADIMSGYRVFSRRFVKNYPIVVEGFEIETDLTLHALDKRYRIVEIPVEYKDRPNGSTSKLNTFSDGARVLFVIMQIFRYYKPFMFFGCISLLLFLAGLLAAVPVIQDWINYKYIYHIPLAILATGLEIVAVMTLGIGLVLDSIVYQKRLDNERQILQFTTTCNR